MYGDARLEWPQAVLSLPIAAGPRVEMVVNLPGMFQRLANVPGIDQQNAVASGFDDVSLRCVLTQSGAQVVANASSQVSHQMVEPQQRFVLVDQ